jgi:2Fe-2S ferredoxin
MYTINVIDELGNAKKVEYEAGYTLMEALREAGYEQILAMCGGGCSCATCHVHIAVEHAAKLPEMEEDEMMLLEVSDNFQADLSRLSCQIELTPEHDGLAVTLIELD